MGSFSIWHWLIILVVVLVAFGGAGKIPRMMGDMAKGIKAFKTGMRDGDEEPPAQPPATTPAQPPPAAQASAQPQPAQPAPAQQPRAHAQ